MEASWYNYVALALLPFFYGIGVIAMRQIRTLNVILVPLYSNILVMTLSILVCSFGEKGYLPSDVDLESAPKWQFLLIAILCAGTATLSGWYLRALCLKYDKVSHIAPIFNLQTPIALILDITVFGLSFTTLQIVGFTIVVGVFIYIIVSAYL